MMQPATGSVVQSPERGAGRGRMAGRRLYAVGVAGLVLLAALTLVGTMGRDGVAAGSSMPALALAAGVLALSLAMRRYLGATLAFGCGAIQAVWLMPAVLAPSVAVGEVPDAATRLASIDDSLSRIDGTAFAIADRPLVRPVANEAASTAVLPTIAVRYVTAPMFQTAPGSQAESMAHAAAAELPMLVRLRATADLLTAAESGPNGSPSVDWDSVRVRLRDDGSVVMEWLGHVPAPAETPATGSRAGGVHSPQRI